MKIDEIHKQEKANEINAQFIETSAKNARNVQEAFENMARILVHQAYSINYLFYIDNRDIKKNWEKQAKRMNNLFPFTF